MTDEDGAGLAHEVVVRRLEGFPAVLRTGSDGAMLLEAPDGGALPALEPGERLHVTRTVRGDASYRTPARVVRVQDVDGRAELHPVGAQQRDQQRSAVRVQTTGIDAGFVIDDGADAAGEVRDLSAGGVRVVLDRGAGVEVGQVLMTQVDLPRRRRSSIELRLAGEVAWTEPLDDGRTAVGIEFHHDDEALVAQLTRWVWDVETSRMRPES